MTGTPAESIVERSRRRRSRTHQQDSVPLGDSGAAAGPEIHRRACHRIRHHRLKSCAGTWDRCNQYSYVWHCVGCAQFAFALILELCHNVGRHSQDVKNGGWNRSADWSYHLAPLVELHGRTLGLIGLGRIGGQTAVLAKAFGMEVIAHDPGPAQE